MIRRYFGLILVFSACQSAVNPSSSPPPQASPAGGSGHPSAPAQADATGQPSMVSQVQSLSDGISVVVAGYYAGWNGPCLDKPPTRSAWQLTETQQPNSPCIYVDGAALSGVSPASPARDVQVQVRGKMVLDGATRYIKADAVERK